MAGVPDSRTLGTLEIFRGLSPSELTRINDLLGRSKFASGAVILTASQPGGNRVPCSFSTGTSHRAG